jgi:hypothetical protein
VVAIGEHAQRSAACQRLDLVREGGDGAIDGGVGGLKLSFDAAASAATVTVGSVSSVSS